MSNKSRGVRVYSRSPVGLSAVVKVAHNGTGIVVRCDRRIENSSHLQQYHVNRVRLHRLCVGQLNKNNSF